MLFSLVPLGPVGLLHVDSGSQRARWRWYLPALWGVTVRAGFASDRIQSEDWSVVIW